VVISPFIHPFIQLFKKSLSYVVKPNLICIFCIKVLGSLPSFFHFSASFCILISSASASTPSKIVASSALSLLLVLILINVGAYCGTTSLASSSTWVSTSSAGCAGVSACSDGASVVGCCCSVSPFPTASLSGAGFCTSTFSVLGSWRAFNLVIIWALTLAALSFPASLPLSLYSVNLFCKDTNSNISSSVAFANCSGVMPFL